MFDRMANKKIGHKDKKLLRGLKINYINLQKRKSFVCVHTAHISERIIVIRTLYDIYDV